MRVAAPVQRVDPAIGEPPWRCLAASHRPRRPVGGRPWMHTPAVPGAADLAPRHSVRNQWDLLAPLGIDGCDPAGDALEMPEDPAARERVDRRLAALGVLTNERIAVIHVSAGNPFRRWPAESFSRLASDLARRDPQRWVFLTSGPSDHRAAAAIVEAARLEAGAAGGRIREEDFDLAELPARAGRAAVYIGGDSGPLHIASTTRTPIVALLGPTLAERSRPWRDPRWFSEIIDAGPLPCRPCQQRRCEPGDFRCLSGISAERVLAAAERGLAASGGDAGGSAPGVIFRGGSEENHTRCHCL